MAIPPEKLRAIIEVAEFADGQRFLINTIRQEVRRRIFEYAQRRKIMDFSDTQLVEQTHRDWRQSRIDAAANYAAQAQAATTTDELLTIFDTVAPFLG